MELAESISIYDARVSESMLSQCLASIPTSEEVESIMREGPRQQAEQFMLKLAEISMCKEKLELMIFRVNFNENYNNVKHVIFV